MSPSYLRLIRRFPVPVPPIKRPAPEAKPELSEDTQRRLLAAHIVNTKRGTLS